MMKNTNHYCCSQSYQSREHLISKFSNEVMANRRILTKLVLKPLRVSLKMLEDFVIRCYKYESHLEHQLRCTSLSPWCGVFMNSMPYVKVWSIDALSTRLVEQHQRSGPALINIIHVEQPAQDNLHFWQLFLLSCEQWKDRAHLSLCYCLAKELLSTHSSSTFVNLLFKHRLKIKVLAWL
jgi:hypothetical protein